MLDIGKSLSKSYSA